VNRDLVEHLIDAAVNDRGAATTLLREHPELLTARYIHNETPLHFCAVEGYVDGVRFFAEAGVPVDATNEFGDTALIDAATLGNVAVAKILLQFGADPNTTSVTREQVLHIAVSQGSTELVSLLIVAGARADYTTSLGETIWDAVSRSPTQCEKMLDILASHGVRP
jgi:uncharacterized protein